MRELAVTGDGYEDDLLLRLRMLARGWDATPDPAEAFPADRVRALHGIGALGWFASVEPGAETRRLLNALRLIGGADLSLGRVFEGHVNAIQLVQALGSKRQRATLASDLAAGALFGVWNTERDPGVTLHRDGAGWRLAGAKIFATGAGRLDRVLITAGTAEGGRQLVLADVADTEKRADNAAWAVRGMRGTISGRYDFTDLPIDEASLIGAPGEYMIEPRFSAGAWRFAAVQLGAVEALLRHFRDHLVAAGKADDPIQRVRFLSVATAVRSAGMWVRIAADRAEQGDADAVPFVLVTRGLVEDAGLAVMEAAARGVGTAAFFTGNRIDRITRDLGLYLRQPAPDQARDRGAAAWLDHDIWSDDRWW